MPKPFAVLLRNKAIGFSTKEKKYFVFLRRDHNVNTTIALLSIGLLGTSVAGACAGSSKILYSFDSENPPTEMIERDTEAKIIARDNKKVLKVKFHTVDWPALLFNSGGKPWDWSAYTGIEMDIYNPAQDAVMFGVRVDNTGANGTDFCNTGYAIAQANQWTHLKLRFITGQPERFWGMRGVPGRGPLGQGKPIDTSKVTEFQVFLPMPQVERTLLIDSISLFSNDGVSEENIKLPFVDKFGQYVHAEWPGKLHSESEFASRQEQEEKKMAATPQVPGFDKYGGWADGPKLNATGWFRTEKVDGKWSLVTPEGHVFFSLGVDCITVSEQTFVEKREPWFAWLPDANDTRFKDCYGSVSGAHSWAEPVSGKGRTFNFNEANLIRKYGDDWKSKWMDTAIDRLKYWGFNTIGNWSNWDALKKDRMPYVVCAGVAGDFRRIEGGGGYWGKMCDVYDPKFAEAAESCIQPTAEKYAADSMCIGYFVDNELSWDAVEKGTLASPVDQPCRIAQIDMLKSKYASLDDLNKAWDTKAASWDDLRAPDKPNDACQKDLDEFTYAFARKYYETVKSVLRKYAPNQLDLGSRFATAPKMAVKACADVVDVVSVNLYTQDVDSSICGAVNSLDKPVIIGEFHFGALDRGMFHPGLVQTKDQADRAQHYAHYVESALDCAAIVGCHWFQYVDEPITGRWFDGENYNIGFVDVTDTPYPEMVEMARKINPGIYNRRYGNRNAKKRLNQKLQ